MSDHANELLTARLRSERGFTLIEVMVAMMIGLVVSGATLAIVIVSVHLGSNYTDRVDANQQGRLAMEKITQALDSSCVTPNQAPILVGSTDTSMSFYSGQNDTPGAIPNEVTVSLASPQPAPLLMTTQTLTGTAPAWTATTTAPTVYTLAPSVMQSVSAGATLPVFQYYAYGSGGTIATVPFTVASGGLTAAQAAATAKVAISYQALPTDNQSTNGRAVDFSDTVVFRLTPPSGSPNAANLPCA
jgi:prepilin-type N-terminal cleavage/methylation domain-containing protein